MSKIMSFEFGMHVQLAFLQNCFIIIKCQTTIVYMYALTTTKDTQINLCSTVIIFLRYHCANLRDKLWQ